MNNDKKIKAIIFDMDGVLINAKQWHFKAFNQALRLFGLNISIKEHLTHFDGLPTKTKLKMLSQRHNLPKNLHSFINEIKQIYTLKIVNAYCVPNKTRKNALKRLKSEGYKIALCSNSIANTIETMMNKADLMPYLDFFLSNEDVKMPKPSPEIYVKAIKRLKLVPKEVLILEDNINGIKAAKASKAHLMEIKSIAEVNYKNIKNFIAKCERKQNENF